jgi:hypothetical protein
MGWLEWIGIAVAVQVVAGLVAIGLFSINRRDDGERTDDAASAGGRRARGARAAPGARIRRPVARPAGKRGRFA